ncbi:MAG TPA: tRNA (adenosine(37)-N6)-threonylcarbamoyltransferase complex ATPase subunit type 1 TsaE [Alphaproteobacteria bacterium]|nr:tRNA (adenosine(37)-N6)-threonylcarbamoyltransferase complex ATPase subunit type 1 TsaE [Alphaproteobacteria bacterium]
MTGAETSVDLPDAAATLALGRRLAALVGPGDVITLSGELGAGKTTLARGLISGLAARAGLKPEEVPSPSFPIVETYELGPLTLWHFDFYRIEEEKELEELGLSQALASGVTLVEWPERVWAALPEERLDIRLEWAGDGRRALLAAHTRSGHVWRIEEAS